MKLIIRLFALVLALALPTWAALEYKTIDSGQPGPTLIVFASEKGAPTDALRQLLHGKVNQGKLVLARNTVEAANWETAPDLSTLTSRFGDMQLLIFREEEEAHASDRNFQGDTVKGNGDASAHVFKAIRSLPCDVEGKRWHALSSPVEDRRIVVTANSRADMKSGLRPVVREREFRTAAAALMRHLEMVDDQSAMAPLFPPPTPDLIRVAVYDGPGALSGEDRGPSWLRARLSRAGGMAVELVGPFEILNGALEHADCLVMGGGKVTPQSEALGEEGRKIVARFVHDGGGYFGICAGAYLGSNGAGKWKYLDLLPVETGSTDLQCDTPLVWQGGPFGEERVEAAAMRGGPTFQAMNADAEGITIWARFQQNESSANTKNFEIKGTPALISGLYGRGRVVLTATHIERAPSPSNIFPEAVRWTAADFGL
jgi:glutamine amidotransferase-like uncharacterized protein